MKKRKLICTAFLSLLLFNTGCSDTPAYKNADVPVENRVNDLLSRMTLEEKAAQLDMLSANDILDGPDKLKVTMFVFLARRDGCSRPLPHGAPRAMSICVKRHKCNKLKINFMNRYA